MHILIIGNGIAGTNAARFIRKYSEYTVTMVSDETLQPFSRTALMYVYMGHMRLQDTHLYEDWFWAKNRIERVQGRVVRLDRERKTAYLDNGNTLPYDKLVIATGSIPNRFSWKGQDLKGVQGLYHLQDLDTMIRDSAGLERAVVVGGGLIGVEMAEMFHSRHIPVTFLVRENGFWCSVLPPEESAMVNRHLRDYGIDLRLGTELREITDDGQGRVAAAVTTQGDTIPCGFVGLTVGVRPNIDFLRDSGLELGRGILVDDFLATSDPNIYAVGDCAEVRTPRPGRKAIEAVWYTGRTMGQTVASSLCGRPTVYDPGIWFNSAKFFDIEYQVYGEVPAHTSEPDLGFFWQHPDGKKSVRFHAHPGTGAISGFNLMGVRFRQEVCEKWIREKASLDNVLEHLSLAFFDPEFYPRYEKDILQQYQAFTGKSLSLKSPRGITAVRQFLS